MVTWEIHRKGPQTCGDAPEELKHEDYGGTASVSGVEERLLSAIGINGISTMRLRRGGLSSLLVYAACITLEAL